MKLIIMVIVMISILFTACNKSNEAVEKEFAQQQEQLRKMHPQPNQEKESEEKGAGIARMMPDGTIKVMLHANRAEQQQKQIIFEYKPDDPQYQELLKHIGGMKSGETKTVPKPWPKEENSDDDLKI